VLGVLNVYVPAFGNLAASLGRDGHLPRWFARGVEGGEVPRRGLLLTAILCLGYTAIRFALDLDLEVFVLIHTSSMVAVYLLGMVAAVRLLDRFTVGWWMAVVSVVLVGALVILAGANLLIPAILAVVALVVGFVTRKEKTHA
jgi:amino acid efflux transporter